MQHTGSSSAGSRNVIEGALAVLTLFVIVEVFISLKNVPLLYDEVFHFQRITALLHGTGTRVDWGAMLPGYHVLLAGLLRLSGASAVSAARLITFLISLLSCIAAYLVARRIDRPSALLRVLQYATLPILLPFFPLLYTDTLSLCLLLFALAAALRRHMLLSGAAFTLSVLVRQNNILWAPLLLVIALQGEDTWQITTTRPLRWLSAVVRRLGDPPALLSLLRIGWPFLLPVALCSLFVWVTGRIAFNPDLTVSHPFPSFSLGNIFFTLSLFTVLFFPLVCARVRAAFRLLRRSWVLLLLVALFMLFSFGFHVDHPANSELGRLRDTILLAAASGGLQGFLFWLIGALGMLTMLVTPLQERSFLWLYPLSLLYLGGSWFIETRYAIVPLVLFLLFRKPNSWRVEVLQFACNGALVLWVFS